jgi:hypothetical protein
MPLKGIRPHTWKSGPDPIQHKKHRVWIQQKNQAQWRDEIWNISFEEWCEIWADLWDKRGRKKNNYCMSRKDWSVSWNKDNVEIIPRSQHAIKQFAHKKMGWRSVAQKRLLNQTDTI